MKTFEAFVAEIDPSFLQNLKEGKALTKPAKKEEKKEDKKPEGKKVEPKEEKKDDCAFPAKCNPFMKKKKED